MDTEPRPAVQQLSERSDEALALDIGRGNEAAFDALYARHHGGLLSFSRHLLGSRDEAEDALQHVFLAAHRHLAAGRTPRRVKPWLYTSARNRCLSILRARRDEAVAVDPEPIVAGLAEEVEQRAELRELLRDLTRLPEQQRGALVLFELRDLPQADIAEVLGVDVAKVKSLVHQARTALGDRSRARHVACEDVREQLSVLRGGSLNGRVLKHHVDACEGCADFRLEVRRQREGLSILLPVLPALGFEERIAAALGLGGATVSAAGSSSGAFGLLDRLRAQGTKLQAAAASVAAVAAVATAMAVTGGTDATTATAAGASPSAASDAGAAGGAGGGSGGSGGGRGASGAGAGAAPPAASTPSSAEEAPAPAARAEAPAAPTTPVAAAPVAPLPEMIAAPAPVELALPPLPAQGQLAPAAPANPGAPAADAPATPAAGAEAPAPAQPADEERAAEEPAEKPAADVAPPASEAPVTAPPAEQAPPAADDACAGNGNGNGNGNAYGQCNDNGNNGNNGQGNNGQGNNGQGNDAEAAAADGSAGRDDAKVPAAGL